MNAGVGTLSIPDRPGPTQRLRTVRTGTWWNKRKPQRCGFAIFWECLVAVTLHQANSVTKVTKMYLKFEIGFANKE
ncbi:MAG: hypothetical protein AB1426_05245 [Bacillota bacterium]